MVADGPQERPDGIYRHEANKHGMIQSLEKRHALMFRLAPQLFPCPQYLIDGDGPK